MVCWNRSSSPCVQLKLVKRLSWGLCIMWQSLTCAPVNGNSSFVQVVLNGHTGWVRALASDGKWLLRYDICLTSAVGLCQVACVLFEGSLHFNRAHAGELLSSLCTGYLMLYVSLHQDCIWTVMQPPRLHLLHVNAARLPAPLFCNPWLVCFAHVSHPSIPLSVSMPLLSHTAVCQSCAGCVMPRELYLTNTILECGTSLL